MSKNCQKFEKWRISKGQKLRPQELRPPNIFWTKALFSFFFQESISVASAECLKVLKIWKMKNFEMSKAKTSKAKTPEYLLDESFVFIYFPTVHLRCQCRMSESVKIWKMKNFKRSKTKTSKAKTSKTKTTEYLLDESFVFVYLPTVHLSCQCGMSENVKNLKNDEFQKVEN